MFSGKTEMNMQKARSQASHMALCFKSWGVIFTDPHLAPSRQSRQNLPNNWIFRLVFEFLCLVCHHLIHMYPAELCKLSESEKPTERPRPGHGLSSVHQVSCCNYADPFAKWSRFLPLGKRHSAELPLLLGSLIGKPMSWALNLTGDASKRWIPTTFSTSNHEWYWAWSAQHIK